MIFTPTKSSPRHSHPHHPTSPALPPPHESVSLHFSLPLTLALTPPVPQHPHTFFPSESLSLSMLNQSLSLLYKCHQTSERGRQQLFNELLQKHIYIYIGWSVLVSRDLPTSGIMTNRSLEHSHRKANLWKGILLPVLQEVGETSKEAPHPLKKEKQKN